VDSGALRQRALGVAADFVQGGADEENAPALAIVGGIVGDVCVLCTGRWEQNDGLCVFHFAWNQAEIWRKS
jgi:hypothetical protein